MSLDYVTIKGFKSIADLDRLQLRPLNVLRIFTLLCGRRRGTVESPVARIGYRRPRAEPQGCPRCARRLRRP